MKNMTLSAIAEAAGGTYKGPAEYLRKEAVSVVTDSREAEPGCLYIPIRGERFDGHDFISQAMEAGALAYLTEREDDMGEAPHILVGSTRDALQRIAGFYRRQFDIPVVGITGSVGKTSTKELIASVLSQHFRVLKTQGNLNNNIGLPLTVFRMTDEDEAAVLEMGINHFGEMTELARTAEPDIMVFTNIGTCHLEALGDRDGVFKAKTESFEYLREGGTVILNGEDDKLSRVEEVKGRRPIFYGLDERFRIYADRIRPLGLRGTRCCIHLDDLEFEVTVQLPGEHHVLNALAGAAVGYVLGLSEEEIRKGIESLPSLAGRFNIVDGASCTVIDDCYNANPMSMKASLRVLTKAQGHRTAILGYMAELGDKEKELHREVGCAAGAEAIDCFILAGPLMQELAGGIRSVRPDAEIHIYPDTEELVRNLPALPVKDSTVLVKASHCMQFDAVVKALCPEPDKAAGR